MIEKSLIIIIFMYAASFGMLGSQYILGDVFNITMTNFEGEPIQSDLLTAINEDTLNTVTGNLASLNNTELESNPITGAAGLVVDILTLLTGTYIFNMLSLIGIPDIIIAGMVIIYALMLFRTLIAYLRGV